VIYRSLDFYARSPDTISDRLGFRVVLGCYGQVLREVMVCRHGLRIGVQYLEEVDSRPILQPENEVRMRPVDSDGRDGFGPGQALPREAEDTGVEVDGGRGVSATVANVIETFQHRAVSSRYERDGLSVERTSTHTMAAFGGKAES
jgi:hypothetical protein